MKKMENDHNQTHVTFGDFFANYNHELRTSLHGALGIVSLLSLSELNVEQRAFIQNLKLAMDSMMTQINDAIDFTQTEIVPKLKPIFLPNLLKEIYNLYGSNAKMKNLEFKVEISGDIDVYVFGDEKLLRQALSNLVHNAVKFTSEGSVHLIATILHHMNDSVLVQFMVKDTGRGISEKHLPRLFERYYRGDSSAESGSGLGLAIVKKSVEAMGGELSVSSQLGHGSRFGFELSMKTKNDLVDKEEVAEPMNTLECFEGRRILLAEDDGISSFMMEELLKKMCIDVVVSSNGEEAIDAIGKNQVDIIFMDVNMPKLNGIEATKKIRDMGFQTPIIAITAYAIQGDKDLCLSSGMNDYISKPIQMEVLLKCLKKWLEKPNMEEDDFKTALNLLMEASGLDEETSKYVFKTYLDQTFEIISSIKIQYASGQMGEVMKLLHKLKGSSGNVRAFGIMKKAELLEKDLQTITQESFEAVVDSMHHLATVYQMHM